MIKLRQGKAKSLLESSMNSAVAAVEAYNRPNNSFRIENYIVLMVIAWTKLFHAYFQSTIGERYYYKEKNGRYKLVDGERKTWDLSECLKRYKKTKTDAPLSEAAEANLIIIIGVRNKIEHKYWEGSELDILLFGECQSLLYNFENILVKLFGDDFALNASLAYALQFSQLRAKEQMKSQKMLLSKDMQDIKRYIDKYKSDLSQEIYDSQEYSIKILQIPKVSNTNRSDLAIEFVNWNSLDEKDKESYRKVNSIIKDKIITRNVANANLFKPKAVIKKVEEITGIDIKMHNHTYLWRAFSVRPGKNAEDKFETKDKYCVYDEPHNDYLYTSDWVSFISTLLLKHGFTKDNIQERCKDPLSIEDYSYS